MIEQGRRQQISQDAGRSVIITDHPVQGTAWNTEDEQTRPSPLAHFRRRVTAIAPAGGAGGIVRKTATSSPVTE